MALQEHRHHEHEEGRGPAPTTRTEMRRRALSLVRTAAQSDDRQRGDERELGLGHRQFAAPAQSGVVILPERVGR
jgi:hypothetical protein